MLIRMASIRVVEPERKYNLIAEILYRIPPVLKITDTFWSWSKHTDLPLAINENNMKMIFKQVSMRSRKLNCQWDCTSWQKSEKAVHQQNLFRKESKIISCTEHFNFNLSDFQAFFSELFHEFRALILATHLQWWAKGPIDRFSDTDSIFRLYRTIQSVDFKFRFLYRPIVSVRFEFRFFNRPILFLGLKFRFLYRPRWKTSLCNPLVCVYAYGQPEQRHSRCVLSMKK